MTDQAAPACPTKPHPLPHNHIPPLVGFIVHYWPHQYERSFDNHQPFRADIVHVNENGTVNLLIHNEIGEPNRRQGVTLAQKRIPERGEASFPKR